MKVKQVLGLAVSLALGAGLLAGCSSGSPAAKDSADAAMQALITQAQGMTNAELFQKAIDESNGKTMYGIGNTSRGATAATAFIAALQAIDPSYNGQINWSQPKNNSIFTAINADINSANHTYSMTLIQDGNQIQSKEINTGNLLNFVPKEFLSAAGVDKNKVNPLPLLTVTKVFEYNNLDGTGYSNMWNYVAQGVAPMFMDVNSEPVGKNFLYMLTEDKYATEVKTAFDALPADQQAYFQTTVDSVKGDVAGLGLTGANAAYALAWIKLFVQQYNAQTDDGPICNQLVTTSAAGQSALIVYSKFRAVEESATSSVKNVTVSAFQNGYQGVGGFGYSIYSQILKTSPLPWTAMAFIAYMATEKDGFAPWGKDPGTYSPNPGLNQDHSTDGGTEYPAMNDPGLAWWTSDTGGRLVIEDPAYASTTSQTMSDWIDMIRGGQ